MKAKVLLIVISFLCMTYLVNGNSIMSMLNDGDYNGVINEIEQNKDRIYEKYEILTNRAYTVSYYALEDYDKAYFYYEKLGIKNETSSYRSLKEILLFKTGRISLSEAKSIIDNTVLKTNYSLNGSYYRLLFYLENGFLDDAEEYIAKFIEKKELDSNIILVNFQNYLNLLKTNNKSFFLEGWYQSKHNLGPIYYYMNDFVTRSINKYLLTNELYLTYSIFLYINDDLENSYIYFNDFLKDKSIISREQLLSSLSDDYSKELLDIVDTLYDDRLK